MAQTRRIKRKTALSQKEQERFEAKKKARNESIGTKISKIAIMVVFFVMIVSLLYTVILLA
jgi:uncharacterized ion transporter superfamily protein YfcC